MSILQAIAVQKIVFILGITNVLLALILLASCRCISGSKIGTILMRHQWFKRFYKCHCYLWWVLGTSVILHASLAVILLGIPFNAALEE